MTGELIPPDVDGEGMMYRPQGESGLHSGNNGAESLLMQPYDSTIVAHVARIALAGAYDGQYIEATEQAE